MGAPRYLSVPSTLWNCLTHFSRRADEPSFGRFSTNTSGSTGVWGHLQIYPWLCTVSVSSIPRNRLTIFLEGQIKPLCGRFASNTSETRANRGSLRSKRFRGVREQIITASLLFWLSPQLRAGKIPSLRLSLLLKPKETLVTQARIGAIY